MRYKTQLVAGSDEMHASALLLDRQLSCPAFFNYLILAGFFTAAARQPGETGCKRNERIEGTGEGICQGTTE